MKRLTVNKSVEDMGMYELAHNSCYAKDGVARYRDFDTDIDARDFARKLMVEYSLWKEGEDEELVDDDIFDYSMMDNLMYDTSSATGLIALFYRNLWAMADLHARLKFYEDAEEPHINPGDTLYILLTQDKEVINRKVSRIELGKTNDRIIFTDHSVYTIWEKNWKEYINKTVFEREEEAEQALARMEGENEKSNS